MAVAQRCIFCGMINIYENYTCELRLQFVTSQIRRTLWASLRNNTAEWHRQENLRLLTRLDSYLRLTITLYKKMETRNHLKKRGWIWKAIWVGEFKNNKHMKNKIFFIWMLISLVSTFSVLNASEKNLSTDHYIIQSIVSFLVAFLISFFGLRYYEKK